MYLVGITGGIGSGKSTISKVFNILGIPVYDSDSRARSLMENNVNVREGLRELFGDEALKDKGINKDHLRKVVFSNQENRKKINDLVHPEVGKDFGSWVKENSSAPYLIKEAALLVESGSYKNLDVLIGVFAPKKVRIERVKRRDPFRSEDDIQKIIDSQMSDEQLAGYCHLQVQNDGKKAILEYLMNFDTSLRAHLKTEQE